MQKISEVVKCAKDIEETTKTVVGEAVKWNF